GPGVQNPVLDIVQFERTKSFGCHGCCLLSSGSRRDWAEAQSNGLIGRRFLLVVPGAPSEPPDSRCAPADRSVSSRLRRATAETPSARVAPSGFPSPWHPGMTCHIRPP